MPQAQARPSDPMNEPSAESSGGAGMLEASRREKLRKLQELGLDPWGGRFDDHQPIGEIRQRENEITAASESATEAKDTEQPRGPKIRAAGRIVLQRKAGKLIFLDLRDWTGQIQIMIGRKQVGEENWAIAECLDLGDIIGVDGELKHTRKGELTIFSEKLHFLTKSIATPPAKHEGLTDPELRQRMRYLDLTYTEGVQERFLRRTRIIQSLRQTMVGERFVEIEGPTLAAEAAGAAARPFRTHHNALDVPLFLRIALELPLKQLMVGGIERVYELGRVYRNEGISAKHNPEFTMLEAYQAYGDYHSMMDLTEKLFVDAIRAIDQPLAISWRGTPLDFTPRFARMTYDDALAEYAGVDPHDEGDIEQAANRAGLDTAGKHPGVVKSDLFDAKVEDQLTGPIFILDYPASVCPLTKRKADHPEIAERFELYVAGMEIANAYTELNDPDLQEQLFRTQLEGQKEEDSMARMDHEFLRALRHGMPPAGGLGLGRDRLVMLLTDSASIRDVILFPLLRPES